MISRPYVVCLIAVVHCNAFAVDSQMDIIGGQLADESDFKDVVRVNCSSGMATGTIVGPQTILIPAHLLNSAESKCRLALFDGTSVEFVAQRLQNLDSDINPELDLAFGVIARPLSMIVPAVIGTELTAESVVVVAGFGCTEAGGGGSLGVLHAGSAEVGSVSTAENEFNFDVRGSALCFGDSGSPAYLANRFGESRVVGIGSMSNIKDHSWYVNLTLPRVHELLRVNAERFSVEVCGINASCEVVSP